MTKFIILSSPRSGTHMLRSCLQEHPDIVVQHELFNEAMAAFHPYPLTESAINIINHYAFIGGHDGIKARGFPLHEEQASDYKGKQWKDVWRIIRSMKEIKIIHLNRRNLLGRIISQATARDTQQWTLYPNNKPRTKNTTFTIDADHVKEHFQILKKRYQQAKEIFSEHEMIDVCYEELCSDLKSEMVKIQNFLEVPFVDINPTTQKNPGKNIRETITNYNELKQYFKNTELAEYFDE